MPDRALTFGRYRLEPRGGLMSGAREVRAHAEGARAAVLPCRAPRRGRSPRTSCSPRCGRKPRSATPRWSPASRSFAKRCATMPGSRATSRRCTGAATGSSRRPAPPAAGCRATKPPALPLPDRPSIAVLPFANMSGDPDQEYFADGISEDLITGLARIRWLFVIARNSTLRLQEPRGRREAGLARAWRPLRARRQRAPRRQAGCASARSSSMRRPAAITGPNATTASSATSSPCRTRSPAASRRRSSPTCWPRRAFARFRARPTISAPGSSWRARKRMSGA